MHSDQQKGFKHRYNRSTHRSRINLNCVSYLKAVDTLCAIRAKNERQKEEGKQGRRAGDVDVIVDAIVAVLVDILLMYLLYNLYIKYFDIYAL